MAKKKTKKQEVLRKASPKGKAMYPFLFKPSTKFHKEGVFKVGLVLNLDDPGVKEYLKEIRNFRDEVDAGPKLPFIIDKDANTATVSFKSTKPPAVIDRVKEPIVKDPLTGNGSIIKVSATFAPFEGFGGGITAYLNAVQIIKNIPFTPGLDDFDVEEEADDDLDPSYDEDEEIDEAGAEEYGDEIPF